MLRVQMVEALQSPMYRVFWGQTKVRYSGVW